MPKRYSLMKVEDDDTEGKTVTDTDADFHKKQIFLQAKLNDQV